MKVAIGLSKKRQINGQKLFRKEEGREMRQARNNIIGLTVILAVCITLLVADAVGGILPTELVLGVILVIGVILMLLPWEIEKMSGQDVTFGVVFDKTFFSVIMYYWQTLTPSIGIVTIIVAVAECILR